MRVRFYTAVALTALVSNSLASRSGILNFSQIDATLDSSLQCNIELAVQSLETTAKKTNTSAFAIPKNLDSKTIKKAATAASKTSATVKTATKSTTDTVNKTSAAAAKVTKAAADSKTSAIKATDTTSKATAALAKTTASAKLAASTAKTTAAVAKSTANTPRKATQAVAGFAKNANLPNLQAGKSDKKKKDEAKKKN